MDEEDGDEDEDGDGAVTAELGREVVKMAPPLRLLCWCGCWAPPLWWTRLVLVSEGDDRGEDADEKEEPRVGDADAATDEAEGEVVIACICICCWWCWPEGEYSEDEEVSVAPDGWRCCTVAVWLWLLRDA
jgi:hypothetical protein